MVDGCIGEERKGARERERKRHTGKGKLPLSN